LIVILSLPSTPTLSPKCKPLLMIQIQSLLIFLLKTHTSLFAQTFLGALEKHCGDHWPLNRKSQNRRLQANWLMLGRDQSIKGWNFGTGSWRSNKKPLTRQCTKQSYSDRRR
jgi:hypothetical protein